MTTRTGFVSDMLGWLNARHAPRGIRLEADTPLFATGAIDSIKILELIAWTERAIGRRIPDPQIRLDNFRSVARIAEVFVGEAPADGGEGSDAAA